MKCQSENEINRKDLEFEIQSLKSDTNEFQLRQQIQELRIQNQNLEDMLGFKSIEIKKFRKKNVIFQFKQELIDQKNQTICDLSDKLLKQQFDQNIQIFEQKSEEKQISELKATISEYHIQNDSLKLNNSLLTASQENLKERIKQLQELYDAIQKDNANLLQERNKIKYSLDLQLDELKNIKIQNHSLTSKNQKIMTELEKANEKFMSLITKNVELTQLINTNQKQANISDQKLKQKKTLM